VSLEGDRRTTEAPEYETIYAFGPNCGVDDPEVIIAANELCAQYGLDTISTGVALSFAMECRQRGLWPDGPDIHFGDGPALLEAIESLARRRPGYRELADGVRKAARGLPGGSELAIQVKGLELPGYDPRGMKGQALCYALADRGGCHLRSSTLGPELLGHPEGYDRLEYNGKAELIARMQLDKILFNTLPVCLFGGAEIKIEDGLAAAVAMTGRGLTYDQLRQTAERIRTLIRMFNAREGLDRRRDTLPQRLFDQPSTHGPSRGETVDRDKFEQLLTEYYRLVGWDPDTGLPTDETKARLGLNHAF
jgi:aldehyde:ferredoxin oxidoreductase